MFSDPIRFLFESDDFRFEYADPQFWTDPCEALDLVVLPTVFTTDYKYSISLITIIFYFLYLTNDLCFKGTWQMLPEDLFAVTAFWGEKVHTSGRNIVGLAFKKMRQSFLTADQQGTKISINKVTLYQMKSEDKISRKSPTQRASSCSLFLSFSVPWMPTQWLIGHNRS